MRLTRKETLPDQFDKYDLEVEGVHNFVAEGVVVHNSNSRVGIVEGDEMAGSHALRRKRPETILPGNLYWFPWTLEPVRNLLRDIARASRQASITSVSVRTEMTLSLLTQSLLARRSG